MVGVPWESRGDIGSGPGRCRRSPSRTEDKGTVYASRWRNPPAEGRWRGARPSDARPWTEGSGEIGRRIRRHRGRMRVVLWAIPGPAGILARATFLSILLDLVGTRLGTGGGGGTGPVPGGPGLLAALGAVLAEARARAGGTPGRGRCPADLRRWCAPSGVPSAPSTEVPFYGIILGADLGRPVDGGRGACLPRARGPRQVLGARRVRCAPLAKRRRAHRRLCGAVARGGRGRPGTVE